MGRSGASAAAAVAYDQVAAEAPDLPMIQHSYQRALAMQKDGIVSQQALDDAQQSISPPPIHATGPPPRSRSTAPSSTRPKPRSNRRRPP